MRWPLSDASSPRSSSNCMTIAVEVSTKPAPATNDAAGGKPVSTPTSVNNAAQAATCAKPRPKIWRRIAHNRDGRISRPMMKRNITTPSSATRRMSAGSRKTFKPYGPITSPAAR